MTSKPRSVYRCGECGVEYLKWGGRCDSCEAWNTLVEEAVGGRHSARQSFASAPGDGGAAPVRLGDLQASDLPRIATDLGEFDFVLGGGIVPGSLTLIGGEPGIGKSTLLLQVAARTQRAGLPTLYATGEESAAQVRLRAERLREDADDVTVLPEVKIT